MRSAPSTRGLAAGLSTLVLLTAPAQVGANEVKAVVLEKLETSALLQDFQSRYAVHMTLADPIDTISCTPAKARVKSVTLDVGQGRSEVFGPNRRLMVGQPCGSTELYVPMTLDARRPLAVIVQLSSGETVKAGPTELPKLEDTAAYSPASVLVADTDLMLGEDGKLGLAITLSADLRVTGWPVIGQADQASFNFNAETAAADNSRAFKDAVKLDTQVSWLFGKVGSYYQIVAKPIALEADDDFHNINYKGSLGAAARVPGSVYAGRQLQRLVGGCGQSETLNCTSQGLIVGGGYSANTKVKRQDGQVDKSNDYVTVFDAVWSLPLTERLSFNSKYSWQSDSPDGSSSESSEVGFTIAARCKEGLGVKISWINGEFMPGEARRDAFRVGLTTLLGKTERSCG